MIQPLFSLRSAQSFGIGDFADLKKAVLWAKSTGLKLIQLLPINDTIATWTWRDSYPYAAISVFALHPVYIDVRRLGSKNNAPKILAAYEKRRQELNALETVDYEAVLALKWTIIQQFFQLDKQTVLATKDYQQFFAQHQQWLVPYSCFCSLRDHYQTADFSKWKEFAHYDESLPGRLRQQKEMETQEQLDFYYYLQYQLHLQLKDATEFAHQHGVVLKGDIAIGVYKNSVDVWKNPELFHRNEQAGAPPDDFSTAGQNWGFPTYNWPAMQARNFAWWRSRLQHMEHYFDAIRIDHILGFFRIWSIPDTAVEGMLGYFQPAIPVLKSELQTAGVHFPLERLFRPYLHLSELKRIFADELEVIAAEYLDPLEEGLFRFKTAFDSQRKVQDHFERQEKSTYNKWLFRALLGLHSNLVLLEERPVESNDIDPAKKTVPRYHFRFNMQQTSSFQRLHKEVRNGLDKLYQDYFFQRQNKCWELSAIAKLPALRFASNMLICGEDLGFTPSSVPKVMDELSMLRLFVQRMPKVFGQRAEDLSQVPYLSVVSPSTHDTSSIRGWWLGLSHQQAQIFYQEVMQQTGTPPGGSDIPGWLNKKIVEMHMAAPAMWSIFLIQDLLNNDDKFHTENPDRDQINHPENPDQYWNYRMPVTFDQLMKEDGFNQALKDLIQRNKR